MKTRQFFVGGLFAVVFALIFVACDTDVSDTGGTGDGGGDPTVLEGEWESSGGQSIIFSKSSFIRYRGSTPDYKGTFSLSNGTINFSIGQYSTDGGAVWQTRNQYIDSRILALGMAQAIWNGYTETQKQAAREAALASGAVSAPTSDSGAYELILDDTQLIIRYADSSTVVYLKKGSPLTVPEELLGRWTTYPENPGTVVLEFTVNQLFRRDVPNSNPYTKTTGKKIEIGTSPGVFDQDFCTSYEIEDGILTFTGGKSEDWYASKAFKKYVFPPITPTPLVAGEWKDDSITSDSEGQAWYSFSVTAGTTYRVWWNESGSPGSTKTLNVRVSGYYSDETGIAGFSNIETAWDTAKSFTPASSGTVYLKVTPASSGSIGSFGIVYNTGTNTARPGVTFIPPAAIELTPDEWEDGEITGGETEAWYSLIVDSGTPYYFWWNETIYNNGNRTKTLDINVRAFNSDGSAISSFGTTGYAWDNAKIFNPVSSGTVYIQVTTAISSTSSTGTFGIVYSTTNTRPNVRIDAVAPIPLIADEWRRDEITSNDNEEIWYSIDVTGGTTYRLWWNEAGTNGNGLFRTLDVSVSAWYASTGDNSFYNWENGWSSARPFTVPAATQNDTVYIKVSPKTAGETGTFDIIYSSTATSRPKLPFWPDEPPNPIPLTERTWTDGEITANSGGEIWYSIDITSSTPHHVHLNEVISSNGHTGVNGDGYKTLDITTNAWYSNGDSVLSNVANAWDGGKSFTPDAANVNGKVFIRIRPATEGNTGTFGITYTKTTSRFDKPNVPVDIPALDSVLTLTEGIWVNGEITAENGEVWYYFHCGGAGMSSYLWLNDYSSSETDTGNNTKTLDVYVNAWFPNGNQAINDYVFDSAWTTPGQLGSDPIYLRVFPKTPGDTGTFGIAYSKTSTNTRPPTD